MHGWTRQPPAGTPIDWSNPLSRGSIFGYLPTRGAFGTDYVGHRASALVSGGDQPVIVAGAAGQTVRWYGYNTLYFPRDAALEPANAVTLLAYVRADSATMRGANNRPIIKTYGNNQTSPYSSWDFSWNAFGTGPNYVAFNVGLGGGTYAAATLADTGVPTVVVGTYDGAHISLYQDGVLVAQAGASGVITYDTTSTGDLLVSGVSNVSGGDSWSGDIYLAHVWNRALASSEVARLRNPWQLFVPLPRRRVYSLPGGGGVYDVSIAESASAADALSAQAVYAGTLAESGTAADSLSALASFVAALAESGAGAETLTGSAEQNAALAESGNASDTLSNGSIYTLALSESGAAADTVSALTTALASLAEAAAASDAFLAELTAISSLTESGAALDALSGQLQAVAAIAESGAAGDTVVGNATLACAILEAANAQDAIRTVELALPFDAERLVALPYGRRMVVLAYARRVKPPDYDRRLN